MLSLVALTAAIDDAASSSSAGEAADDAVASDNAANEATNDAAASSSAASDAENDDTAEAGNSPIRRALTMLRGMARQVEQHVRKEDLLFDKQSCHCVDRSRKLQQSIAEAQEKLPQLTSSVQEAQSTAKQLENDLKEHKASKDAATKAMRDQNALRKNEAQAFAKASGEMKVNIGNIKKAVVALGKAGSKKSLLQTGTLDSVRSFAQTVNPDRLRDEDRERMTSLLESFDSLEEGGESSTTDINEVIGMLKQMLENMQADLKEMTKKEESAIAQLKALNMAKQKELVTLGTTIDEKQGRLSTTKVEMVQQQKELDSTKQGLKSDKGLKDNLDKECEQRKNEHAKTKGDLQQETLAIAEAIKVLSSDQAMATFSKAKVTRNVATASFLQLGMSSDDADDDPQEAAEQVSDMLKKMSAGRADGDSFSLLVTQAARAADRTARAAASVKRGHGAVAARRAPSGVAKIKKLIDNMVALLKKEQEDDDLKRQMCTFELKQQNANVKKLGEQIEARTADLNNVNNQHQGVVKDMTSLKAGIEALDKSTAEETKQRKEAHAAYVKRLADNHAALELLHMAKKKLQKVYKKSFIQQPLALVQAPKEAAPALGDDFGFEDVADDAGITVRHEEGSLAQQDAEVPKPTMMNDGTRVVKLLTTIENDINKENADAKANEVKDQAAYEKMMAASAKKREADSKSLSQRAATAAELAENRQSLSTKRKALRGELEQTKKVVANLKKECDWLLAHYDKRKTLRAGEAEALKRTLAVLAGSGKKLGLLQTQ